MAVRLCQIVLEVSLGEIRELLLAGDRVEAQDGIVDWHRIFCESDHEGRRT